MATIKERYQPRVVAVNGVVNLTGDMLGGFLAITAGTVTVVDHSGVTIINALPVTAGVYYPLPFYLGNGVGGTFTAAGGASGTLGV